MHQKPLSDIDQYYSDQCLRLSKICVVKKEKPFSCVLVRNNEIIASSCNQVEKDNDVTSHAELLVLRQAQQILKTRDLSDCTLYSICEPCPMCSFMIRELRVGKVVYSLPSPNMGGKTKWNILEDENLERLPVFAKKPTLVKCVNRGEAMKVFKKAKFVALFSDFDKF